MSCERHSAPASQYQVATKGVYSADISDDGKNIVIGSIHHGGSLWSNRDKGRLFTWNHKAGEVSMLTAVDFSHKGDRALTAESHTMVLWDTQTGEAERFWSAPGEVLDAELGPNSDTALLGLSDHSAVLFKMRIGGLLRNFQHSGRVRSVDLSRDGKIALTGSEDYTAVAWNVETGKAITRINHNDDVQLVKLSDDGSIAFSASKYDKALLWQTRTGEEIGKLPVNNEKIKRGFRFTSAKFSADNQLLLTGRPDQVVQLWDVNTLTQVQSWKIPKEKAWKPTGAAIVALGFIGNNTFIAVASNGFVHELKGSTSQP